jgi:thiol-disulfide isomerase/thioredoxin
MTPDPKPRTSPLPFLFAFALSAAAVAWYSSGDKTPVTEAVASQQTGALFGAALATGNMKKLVVHPERREVPAINFKDGKGTQLDLSTWKGKVVVLNLWAIWCPPCRKEMPDLAALQKELGGKDFEVVALSVDIKGYQVAHDFLKEVGAENITLVNDATMKSLSALREIGLPVTIIVDKQGKEAARHVGEAKWNSPDAQAVVKALMAE